jgi:hypothetical protein
MATPELVTVRDFTTSPYSQLADNLDTPLTDILSRAESYIQQMVGMSLGVKTYTERWKANSSVLFVKHRPIVAVTSLKIRDNRLYAWETLNLSNLYIEPEPGYIEYYDGIRTGAEVEVEYTAGYSTLPEVLRQAILMQAVVFAYQDLEVYGSGDGRDPGIRYINEDIQNMLRPFKRNATVWH